MYKHKVSQLYGPLFPTGKRDDLVKLFLYRRYRSHEMKIANAPYKFY